MRIISLFTIAFLLAAASSAALAQSPYCGGALGEGCWPPEQRLCYEELRGRMGNQNAFNYCRGGGHHPPRYAAPSAPHRGAMVPYLIPRGQIIVRERSRVYWGVRCFDNGVCIPLN